MSHRRSLGVQTHLRTDVLAVQRVSCVFGLSTSRRRPSFDGTEKFSEGGPDEKRGQTGVSTGKE